MPIKKSRYTRLFKIQNTVLFCTRRLARGKFLPLFLAAIFLSFPVHAAMDMYLDLGTDIPGESTAIGHQGQVDVLAWSWGMSNPATVSTGGTTAGKATFQDLSLTKYVDKASPKLMLNLAKGTHIPKVILYVLKTGGKAGTINYIKITLEEVLVTSLSTGGSGGEDRLTENITLNFSKILYEYFPTKLDGTADTAIPFTWDLSANTAG